MRGQIRSTHLYQENLECNNLYHRWSPDYRRWNETPVILLHLRWSKTRQTALPLTRSGQMSTIGLVVPLMSARFVFINQDKSCFWWRRGARLVLCVGVGCWWESQSQCVVRQGQVWALDRGCSGHDWQHNQSSPGSGHLSVKKTVTTHQQHTSSATAQLQLSGAVPVKW